MKLKDVVKQLDKDRIIIIYRTIINLPDEGSVDIFAGICTYEDGELASGDRDSYSLDDEITRWEIRYDAEDGELLIVWYDKR